MIPSSKNQPLHKTTQPKVEQDGVGGPPSRKTSATNTTTTNNNAGAVHSYPPSPSKKKNKGVLRAIPGTVAAIKNGNNSNGNSSMRNGRYNSHNCQSPSSGSVSLTSKSINKTATAIPKGSSGKQIIVLMAGLVVFSMSRVLTWNSSIAASGGSTGNSSSTSDAFAWYNAPSSSSSFYDTVVRAGTTTTTTMLSQNSTTTTTTTMMNDIQNAIVDTLYGVLFGGDDDLSDRDYDDLDNLSKPLDSVMRSSKDALSMLSVDLNNNTDVLLQQQQQLDGREEELDEDDFLDQQQQRAQHVQQQLDTKQPHLSDGHESFAGCILIMDENHRLPEWLAYHYYALPLRYLIVATDPQSRTSPTPILDRWRNESDMTIIEWDDNDIVQYSGFPDFPASSLHVRDGDGTNVKTTKHRKRQNLLFRACMNHLRQQNRTWTTFHDVDEFVSLNGDKLNSTEQLYKEPGIILKMLKYYRNETTAPATTSNSLNQVALQQKLPRNADWVKHMRAGHCITFARTLYGTVESTPEEIERGVSDTYPWINATKFDTLRFRVRSTPRGGHGFDGPGKSFIDVSKVVPSDFGDDVKTANVHRPLPSVCTSAWVDYVMPWGFHHYIGSWEAYSARTDARDGTALHSYAAWSKRSKMTRGGPDDEIRPWMSNFIKFVGETKAKLLLEGAGHVQANFTRAEQRSKMSPSMNYAINPNFNNRTSLQTTRTTSNNQRPAIKKVVSRPKPEIKTIARVPLEDKAENLSSVLKWEPPKEEPEETFSACILIMDENHRLPEWLAYHYHALPLRHLVVAVDPHSETSPTPIFDKWRKMGMTIEEWTDKNFTRMNLILRDDDPAMKMINKHRQRQNSFYAACVRHLQKQKRTWTAFHDVDEYIAINKDRVKEPERLLQQPGIILKMIKYFRYNETVAKSTGTSAVDVPKQGLKGWFDHFQSSDCITFARALYGSVESKEEEIAKDVPAWIDPKRFDTLRFRYRATKRKGRKGFKAELGGCDGPAKSFLDVSKVKPWHFNGGTNAHRPLKSICSTAWVDYVMPFGFHHYIGSWEAYSARKDAREGSDLHGRAAYEKRSNHDKGGADDELRQWVNAFVENVGESVAKELLEGAGIIPKELLIAHGHVNGTTSAL